MIKNQSKTTERYVAPECEMINLNITSMICLSFGNDTEERQIEDATEGDDWGTLTN